MNRRMRKVQFGLQRLVVVMCLLGWGLSAGCDGNEDGDQADTAGDAGVRDALPMFVNPLFISYLKWDYHLVQWLPDNHPTYEMAELMVLDSDTDDPKVWVFFTEKAAPKHQVHYVNDPWLVEYLDSGGSQSPVHLVPMTFSLEEHSGGILVFDVAFDDEAGEGIDWHFETVEALSTTYGDMLIDQSGHDLERGILVMYVFETALTTETTTLRIGEATFAPPVWEEVSSPPFFTAYHGVCTRGLSHGYLAAGRASYMFESFPTEVAMDATWRVSMQFEERDEVAFDWTVTEMSDDEVVVTSEGRRMVLVEREGGFDIKQTAAENDEGNTTVRFSPPLADPGMMASGQTETVGFSIDIDGHPDQITGIATQTAGDDTVVLLLEPESPEWAVFNQMRATFELGESEYTVATETIQLK